ALVRFAAAWLAGINHMPFRQFFFWNALGGISWGVTFGLVGYFLGSAAANLITEFGVFAVVALVMLVIGLLLLHHFRERLARARERERELSEAAEAPEADAARAVPDPPDLQDATRRQARG